MPTKKIQSTKNYRLFAQDSDNRPVNVKKHKALMRSMKQYGFLECFPIVCHRNGSKQLVVKDGQHRLTIAEMLSLPVHWVEDQSDFDIATINSTSKVWQVEDFARKFASNGKHDYQYAIDFAEQNRIPLTVAAGLLVGHTTWGNVREAFQSGRFKVTDKEYAQRVADIYVPMCALSSAIKNVRFLQACVACGRVEGFDERRLVENAKRCREKLTSYSTRDAYLEMIEDVYNFGRSKLLGVKASAIMSLRERNAATVKKNSKHK